MCIHTRTGAYTDKFYKWRCIFECRHLAQEMKRKHISLIHAFPPQPMRGCHTDFSWIHDITNPREASPTNHTLPHQHHMIQGPTRGENRLKIPHTLKMYPRAHRAVTWPKMEEIRAHRGSAQPWVRPNRLYGGSS